MVSAAAIPALPGADVVGGVEGAAQDIVADVAGGHMRRQVEAVQPVTNGFASSLNGGVGIVGSAVGTAESTISGAGHVKRQLEAVRPVTEGAASSLNGGTGIVGSAVGTAESTSQGAVYTVDNSVGSVGNSTTSTTLLYRGHTANHTAVAKRQLGNLPATAQQTSTDVIAGLAGSKLS